jgi:hypothetical protein
MSVLRRLGELFRRGEKNHHELAPTMTETEAYRIAAAWAAEHQKHWALPATASFVIDKGRRLWVVQTNTTGRGHSLAVTVEDETGKVIAHHELPR